MKLQVKFQAPVIVSTDDLAKLLALAGVAAVVEPYVESSEVAAVPATKPAKVEGTARRGRPPKPQVEVNAPPAEPVGATPGNVPDTAEVVAASEGASVDVTDLQNRFSAFVEKDYDAALAMLETFKVQRFTDLSEKQHSAFAAALSDVGA